MLHSFGERRTTVFQLLAFGPMMLLAVLRVSEKVVGAAREQAHAEGHQRLFCVHPRRLGRSAGTAWPRRAEDLRPWGTGRQHDSQRKKRDSK
jgi:hypothetical protein